MKYGLHYAEGDLVRWSVGTCGEFKTGIVMGVKPSNVYEPEECEVLTHGGKIEFVCSKYLKKISS